MLTLPLMMTSCGELFDMLDNPITPALQVLRAQLTLKVGESKPIQASTQAHVVLLYSSDNPAVATVDATGLITAVSPGTARITIKAQGEDDYYRTEIFSENTTTVEVTVNKGDGSISFAEANVTKNYGDAKFVNTLTIVGDGTVSYSSSNEEVATVNPATGDVTIVDGGKVTITATTTSTDNYVYEKTTAKYTLNIYRLIDLSTLTADFTAKDNYILTGTLAGNYKISIADNANIELKDATINSADVNNDNYPWAGLTCLGNATITITGTNTVKGFYDEFPAIQAGPIGKTLTIDGTGTLTATGGGWAAGIGSGWKASCGNITINSGTVNASSNDAGAGIGSGFNISSCGNITINGGTITASSGYNGAGIGSGYLSSFGSITITSGITKVQATTNYANAWPIGKGRDDQGSTGAVKIAGVTVTGRDWTSTSLPGLNFATSTTGGANLTWTLTSTTAP